jgi:hypothetical protein
VQAAEFQRELIEDIASFTHDPLGYARYAFPWGEPGPLEQHTGPRDWQIDTLEIIRDHLQNPETRYQPCQIARASGHGIGKAQPYSLEVDTPTGLRLWGNINVGDYLFGASGTPVKVIARHEQGVRDIYRVRFNDGSSTLADGDHLWSVKGRQERRCNRDWREMTTLEIVEEGVKRSNGTATARQWEIPQYRPVEYSKAFQSIDPYVMGAWLGDGTKDSGAITNIDEEVWDELAVNYDLGTNTHSGSGDCRTHTLLGLKQQLHALGLIGCGSDGAYVPINYRFASVDQRTSVLQGLLDTDGWVEKSGTVAFGSISAQLAKDVLWLARSLGMVARANGAKDKWYRDKDGNKSMGKPFHMVSITWDGHTKLFRLPRKQSSLRKPEQRYRTRWIDNIEYSHKEKAMCVTVDAADHLYLTSDFIVTHNSALIGMLIRWALDTCDDCRVICTSNTDTQLKTKTVPEVTKWQRMAITDDWFKVTATSIFSTEIGHEKSWRCDFVPWSKDNSEAFAGLHNEGKRIVVIMDEASAIDDIIWEVVEGALTDENTEIIWIAFGNPTRNIGRFRECFRKFSKYWHTANIDSRDVEGTNKQLFERWVEQYGEDSDFFKVRCRGQFPSQSMYQLFSSADVDAAFGKHLRPEEYEFAPTILACDPAWTGDDELVIGLRKGLYYRILERWPKNDNDVQVANRLARLEDEHEADAVNVDGGYGTGIVSAGRTMGREWNLIWFSQKSGREDCFNKRAEMYIEVRDWLKQGGAIPDDQQLYEEMIAVETLPTLDGKFKLPPKDDMKELIGRSPNDMDALALTFALPVLPKLHQSVQNAQNSSYNPIQDRLKRGT